MQSNPPRTCPPTTKRRWQQRSKHSRQLQFTKRELNHGRQQRDSHEDQERRKYAQDHARDGNGSRSEDAQSAGTHACRPPLCGKDPQRCCTLVARQPGIQASVSGQARQHQERRPHRRHIRQRFVRRFEYQRAASCGKPHEELGRRRQRHCRFARSATRVSAS